MISAFAFLLSWASAAAAVDPRDVPGPWENRTVALPGRGDGGEALDVHYLEAGPADAPPIVLLHGFPDSSYGWRYVIDDLALDHHVFAPDLRGYAGSDRPRDGYDLASLAEDVVAFVDRVVGPEATVDLVGHDWGAGISWECAARHRARFHSVTVLSIPHPRALPKMMAVSREQRKYKSFVRTLLSPLAPPVLASLSERRRGKVFYLNELRHDEALRPEDLDYYDEIFDEVAEIRPPLRYYRALFGKRSRTVAYGEAFPEVRVPMLVLWGAEDSFMLEEMAAMSCDEVQGVCVSAVRPDAGHWLHWEASEFVVDQWRELQDRLRGEGE